MQINRNFSFRLFVVLLFLYANVFLCAFAPTFLPEKITADATALSQGETVLEVSFQRVLSSRNAEQKLPMASTTKILTAIIIIEDCNLEDVVKIPAQAAGVEGSSVYLQAGEEMTVEALLYGLMLRSGNDCAVSLALHHSGSIEAFAEVMNERAKAWGANNSHFTNPHGLPDEAHYTTAHDLAVISAHAMQNEVFRAIVSTKYYKPNGWQNKNKMLYEYEGANGVKTGYTIRAGRCLVTAAKRGEMQLVCVVLNSPEMYERTKELLDEAFLLYSMRRIYDNTAVFDVPSDVTGKICPLQCGRDVYYPLKDGEIVRAEVELPSKITLPVKKGEVRGKIRFYIENQLIFSENLCTIKDVEKTYFDHLKEIVERF